MPTLNWIGKDAVVNHHLEVPFRLLRDVPDLSSGHPGSGNLIVEGDNLLALKALLPHYKGRVKCICIDPPYNTGNEGWAYNDNVTSPAIRQWLGQTVGKEGETLDRHDRWLCMMYPRLALLREFLREDGIIFFNIDDTEVAHLRLLMDEVFGAANFVTSLVWQKSYAPRNNVPTFSVSHEPLICYAKSIEHLQMNRLPTTEDQRARYTNPDNDHRGDWKTSDLSVSLVSGQRGSQFQKTGKGANLYEVTTPSGRTVMPPAGRCWVVNEDKFRELNADKRIWWGKAGNSIPQLKRFFAEIQGGIVPQTIWLYEEVGHMQEASQTLKEIFPNLTGAAFPTPKPTRLIERILQIATNPGDLVLDSFAGSGTTGHAVLQMNAAGRSATFQSRAEARDAGGESAESGEDSTLEPERSGDRLPQAARRASEASQSRATLESRATLSDRRFILVEMEERIAQDITRERVRRVAEGYTNAKGAAVPGLGGGFRYVRLGEELFDETGRIRDTVKYADLARHVYFSETGEPLVERMKDEGRRMKKNGPLLGVHHGRAVYLLYNGILSDRSVDGGNVLTTATLALLPPHDGPRVVYAAGCRFSKSRLEREGITFKQTPYAIRVK